MSESGRAPDRPLVALEDVTVGFPQRAHPVLRHVSARVEAGDQVLVLGSSGSGKSTLLHAISGIVPHTLHARVTGTVRVAGCDTARSSVVQLSRDVGWLAQDPSSGVCLPLVEQEIALPLENRAVPPEQIDTRIEESLDRVDATHLRHRLTTELSGGEAQRVALAATLAARPRVLLLDEPTSMLDPAGVSSVRAALESALGGRSEDHGSAGGASSPAVVLVEHRLDDFCGADGLAALPARAIVLDDTGAVLASGPTGHVLAQRAAALHAAGCWLPLEAEILALGGEPGSLASRHNRDLVLSLGTALEAAATAPEARGDAATGHTKSPLLAARRLVVHRDGAPGTCPVLDGIELEIHRGEVIALLGPNGAGKSTLLLALAGLLPVTAGRIDGARPGMVFQQPEHQFLRHTVAEEIGLGLPAQESPRRVAEGLRLHRLDHLADQNPFRLSGGEKRRLSLAAMLAHDRDVLLADEPTLGLDRRDTLATMEILASAAAGGRAVMLSSHDLRTVAAVATRVVVIAGSRVVADGPALEVLADAVAMDAAGLVLPPLLRWLLHEHPRRCRDVLRALDAAMMTSAAGAMVRAKPRVSGS